MTYAELYTRAAPMSNRDPSQPDHLKSLKYATQMAVMEASVFHGWFWTQVNLRTTLVASQTFYAFATADRSGNAIQLASFNIKSFRTAKVSPIEWVNETELDQSDPDWEDGGASGNPYLITLSEGKLALYGTPDADFVADNPTLYYRGWRMMKVPRDTDDANKEDNDALWTDEADMPEHWQFSLLRGISSWVFRLSRADAKTWVAEQQLFRKDLKDCADKSYPVKGQTSDQVAPPPQFRRGVMGGYGTNDYGNRLR